jgi:cytochrome c-type biogenesis protein
VGDWVDLLVAFGGGTASFVSPCVLPLVPVYLSVITGFDVTRTERTGAGGAGVVRDAVLFVAGFSAVFVLLGSALSAVGHAVTTDHVVLARVGGAVVLAMAVFLAATQVVRAPALFQERRLQVCPQRLGVLAAPVTGAAFALGWTPCIGPVLASVLTVASASGGAQRGAELLLAYSLGLGLPFILAGGLLGRVLPLSLWLRQHGRTITLTSAALLGGFGALLLAGRMTVLNSGLG